MRPTDGKSSYEDSALNETLKVREYFDSQADAYKMQSEGALWQLTRKRELRACIHLLEPAKDERTLDAGCGAGYYTRELLKRGCHVTAVDLSDKMLEQIKHLSVEECKQGELESIDFDRPFDKILCAGALEFCPRPGKTLWNLARLTAPGGRLVLLAPRDCWSGRMYAHFHRKHGLNIKLFTVDHLRKTLEQCGMRFNGMRRPTFSMALRFDKTEQA